MVSLVSLVGQFYILLLIRVVLCPSSLGRCVSWVSTHIYPWFQMKSVVHPYFYSLNFCSIVQEHMFKKGIAFVCLSNYFLLLG
ncbi:hypothetical protein VIGAN_08286500 [Vigna angularis var. angularis]|uniref:Secreted protein n=1 Tax=Vigna angularis var. angularis TaxID=157739 RepID=A0A0S3ST35_PHAAN|nr:hypothetical protein VIGAN_08286500 [Vigna angularis var. angularis]